MIRSTIGMVSLALLVLIGTSGCQPPARPRGSSAKTTASAPKAAPTKTEEVAKSAPVETKKEEPKPEPMKPVPPTEDEKKTEPAPDANKEAATVLIPRKQFFGNPEKAHARLSHDGAQLAFLAPLDGVLNVYVAPVDDISKAKAVTKDTHRGIRGFFWAYNNKQILYSQDKDGDEDNHVYAINLESGEIKDLTPIEKIAAQIEGVSEKFPDDILVGINDRGERQYHDIYRINIATGEKKLIQENPGYAGFLTDDDYRVRFAINFTPEAAQVMLKQDEQGEWKEFIKIDALDAMTTGPAGFDKTGEILYMLDSRGRNTAALKSLDLKSGEEKLIAENAKADIAGVMTHPTEKTIEAVSFNYERNEWQILDEKVKADLDYLKTVADGEVLITSRTLDDKKWTVAFAMDDGPVRFYVYDRAAKSAKFLFTSQPSLEKLPLVKMHPVVIKSRDGMNLVSYLSLPKDSDPKNTARPNKPLPLVLNVHGGPWARDSWGYDPEHQLLANRGYAVLSVNYRGSTGFGKEFVNAANREWAGKMHDDLVDAVTWAVEEKIADKDKVAIIGGSYGGYATLVGLTFTPDLFACGVDVVGPSSLLTLMQNPPPYWASFMPVMKQRVGDWETEEGKQFLEARSPLFKVDQIKKPLLICQGAKDPRVKQPEADQIVEAMNQKKIPVTYLLYQQEGHGLARPENRFAFQAVQEAFLAQNLGGRFEPIGDAFEGAVFTVPSGEDGVPGLAEALKSAKPAEKAKEE
ncbi:MAG TPA: alpha/beta fold hydrolase [Pirellulaceae bacterium]|nr:alpha/beta fold hydrolase [Pirellulaceae bacterium]